MKKHSSRPVGGAEMGREDSGKVAAGGPGETGNCGVGRSHIHMQIKWEEQLGNERPCNPGLQRGGNKA